MITYQIEDGPFWQIQEAKAMFSKVVKYADREPQIITVHGKESAVVLSMDSYRKLISQDKGLVNFMEQSPWASVEFELPERTFGELRELSL